MCSLSNAEMKVHLVKAMGQPQQRALSVEGRLLKHPEEYLLAEESALDTLQNEKSRLKNWCAVCWL